MRKNPPLAKPALFRPSLANLNGPMGVKPNGSRHLTFPEQLLKTITLLAIFNLELVTPRSCYEFLHRTTEVTPFVMEFRDAIF